MDFTARRIQLWKVIIFLQACTRPGCLLLNRTVGRQYWKTGLAVKILIARLKWMYVQHSSYPDSHFHMKGTKNRRQTPRMCPCINLGCFTKKPINHILCVWASWEKSRSGKYFVSSFFVLFLRIHSSNASTWAFASQPVILCATFGAQLSDDHTRWLNAMCSALPNLAKVHLDGITVLRRNLCMVGQQVQFRIPFFLLNFRQFVAVLLESELEHPYLKNQSINVIIHIINYWRQK